MRAIIAQGTGGPEVLHIEEVAAPEPAPEELLIRTAGCGVNRADVLQRQGHYPPPAGISDIIGLECSGTVAGMGADVRGWSVGDPCVALLAGGGYAEYVVAPAGQVIPPPRGIDLIVAGGLLEAAATVQSNFDHAHVRAGESILIHGGAGGVGMFAIQYAKALGCRVLTTAGSWDKLALCRELGADVAIDYHADWAAEVNDATGGAGVDVILDIMGAKYLDANVTSLAPEGRLVIIGMQGGVKGELNIGRLLSKRGTVTATSLRFRPVDQKVRITQEVLERVWPLISEGTIVPPQQSYFPLERAADAHAQLESGANVGKIVLTI